MRRIGEVVDSGESPGEAFGETVKAVCWVGVAGVGLKALYGAGRKIPLFIEQRLREALGALKERHPHAAFMVLSTLAEGAPRFLAKALLAEASQTAGGLDAELFAVLPLPFEVYHMDFGEVPEAVRETLKEEGRNPRAESVRELAALVHKTRYTAEVALRFGTLAEVGWTPDSESGASNTARDKQYRLAYAYMVQRCDEMILLGRDAAVDRIHHWWTGAVPLPEEMTWTNRYQIPPQRHPHPIYLSVRPDSEAFGGCPICREAAQA